MRPILRAFALLVLTAAISACGGGGGSTGGTGGGGPVPPVATPTPTPTPMPTPSGATESTQQFVSASQGGNVQLPSGTTLAIPPNALPTSMNVEVATIPKPIQTPSSAALQPVSPAVYVAFSAASSPSTNVKRASAYRRPMGSTSTSNITVTLPPSYVPGSSAAAFVTAIVSICSTSSCIQEGPQIQIDGAGNYFLTLASGLFNGNVPQIVQVVISKAEGIYQPGLRYFDPQKATWTTEMPPPAVHPILLLHGLASSVEDTFSSQMVQQLRANGGYDVVLGYDYNCFKTTDQIVPDIAASVGGYSNLDIMAHSEGTLVAMDLVPLLPSTEIDNMVLIEGPLNGAMMDLGTTAANGAISDARTMFVTLVEDMFPGDSGVVLPTGLLAMTGIQGAVDGVLSDSWFQEFTPGSTVLQGIQSRYAAAKNKPTRVILAAGGTPYSVIANAYQKIMNAPFPTSPQNDGIIPSNSALWSQMTSASASAYGVGNGVFPLPVFTQADHTTLVNNLDYEGAIIQPYINFQFNNSVGGVYYDTPSVFMKGQGTYTGFFVFGNSQDTWWYQNLCCGITTNKKTAPEAADQFSATAANIMDFTLSAAPANSTAIDPSKATDSMPIFTQNLSDPNSQPTQVTTLSIWAYPDCVLCSQAQVSAVPQSILVNPPRVAALLSSRARAFAARRSGAKPVAGERWLPRR